MKNTQTDISREDESLADAVEACAGAFFAAREDDPGLSATSFLEQLPSDDAREQFRQLVAAVDGVSRFGATLRPGVVLDERYVLDAWLGQGGTANVWRARDRKLARDVAVKVLRSDVAGSLGEGARLEAELTHRVGHPDAVKIHDVVRGAEHHYIVMELVDGIAVDHMLDLVRERGRARPGGRDIVQAIGRVVGAGETELLGNEDWYRSVARIVATALRVLEAAHAKGIVHRDIKPGNVVLCAGGRPKLLDFGLGHEIQLASNKLTAGLSGTQPYLAPEQLRTESTCASPAVDIYQMGAVLYEMLTLERAVQGDTSAQVIANILRGGLRDPRQRDRSVPRELADIVLCALESDPTRRYRTAQHFREDLERFLSGTEVPRASRGGLLRRGRAFVRRHREAVGVLAASLVVGVSVWWFMPNVQAAVLVSEVRTLEPSPTADRCAVDIDVNLPCTPYGLQVVTEDGRRRVSPMLLTKEPAADDRLEPGMHTLEFQSTTGPFAETKGKVEVFVYPVVAPEKFEPVWSRLRDYQRTHGDGGMDEAEFDELVDGLNAVTRSGHPATDITTEMLLGEDDAGVRDFGGRIGGELR